MPRKAKERGPQLVAVINGGGSEDKGVEGDWENPSYFPYTVRTFTGKLPGQPGYDEDKDRLRIGFQYGNLTVPYWMDKSVQMEDITAYDFLTYPKTGMRDGQKIPPHGSQYDDLTDVSNWEWINLPPLQIWREGEWLSKLMWEADFDYSDLPFMVKDLAEKAIPEWPPTGVPPEIFGFWVVSGEGTTGNNLYRVYKLPEEIAKRVDPHHPLMWPKKFRPDPPPKTVTTYGGSHPLGRGSTYTPPKPSPPPIPAGVRYRCSGCGHWFSQSDLPGHAMVCGKGEDADWAMMCHSDCGCRTLDEASRPKPGFPRVKPAPDMPEEEEGEVTADA